MKMRKNIEILDKTPTVSKEEVASYMDFDAVLSDYKSIKKTGKGQMLKGVLIVVGVALLAVSSYYFTKNNGSEATVEAPTKDLEAVSETSETDFQEAKPTENSTSKKAENNNLVITEKPEKEESKQQVTKRVEKIKENNRSQTPEKPEKKEAIAEAPYRYVEAVPVEGLTYLYAYFNESLTYPEELRKDSIEGVVLISFSILKDSTVSDVTIVKSLGDKFDNEAKRVILNMPKWIPATVNDTPVNSKLSIPLTFNIEK